MADPDERVTVPVERDTELPDPDMVPDDRETDPADLDTEDCTLLLTVFLFTAVSPEVLLRDTLDVLPRDIADPVLPDADLLTELLETDEVLGPYEAVEFLEP